MDHGAGHFIKLLRIDSYRLQGKWRSPEQSVEPVYFQKENMITMSTKILMSGMKTLTLDLASEHHIVLIKIIVTSDQLHAKNRKLGKLSSKK